MVLELKTLRETSRGRTASTRIRPVRPPAPVSATSSPSRASVGTNGATSTRTECTPPPGRDVGEERPPSRDDDAPPPAGRTGPSPGRRVRDGTPGPSGPRPGGTGAPPSPRGGGPAPPVPAVTPGRRRRAGTARRTNPPAASARPGGLRIKLPCVQADVDPRTPWVAIGSKPAILRL